MPVATDGELSIHPSFQCDQPAIPAGLPGIANQIQHGLSQLPRVGQKVGQTGIVVTFDAETAFGFGLDQMPDVLRHFVDVGGLRFQALVGAQHAVNQRA